MSPCHEALRTRLSVGRKVSDAGESERSSSVASSPWTKRLDGAWLTTTWIGTLVSARTSPAKVTCRAAPTGLALDTATTRSAIATMRRPTSWRPTVPAKPERSSTPRLTLTTTMANPPASSPTRSAASVSPNAAHSRGLGMPAIVAKPCEDTSKAPSSEARSRRCSVAVNTFGVSGKPRRWAIDGSTVSRSTRTVESRWPTMASASPTATSVTPSLPRTTTMDPVGAAEVLAESADADEPTDGAPDERWASSASMVWSRTVSTTTRTSSSAPTVDDTAASTPKPRTRSRSLVAPFHVVDGDHQPAGVAHPRHESRRHHAGDVVDEQRVEAAAEGVILGQGRPHHPHPPVVADVVDELGHPAPAGTNRRRLPARVGSTSSQPSAPERGPSSAVPGGINSSVADIGRSRRPQEVHRPVVDGGGNGEGLGVVDRDGDRVGIGGAERRGLFAGYTEHGETDCHISGAGVVGPHQVDSITDGDVATGRPVGIERGPTSPSSLPGGRYRGGRCRGSARPG